ncbi:MAG: DUF1287 domain-containing protein [Rhizomicrobium sp.]
MRIIARLVCVICATWLLQANPCFANQKTAVQFVHAAIALYNPNVRYDSGYRKIAYPLGDVPQSVGVCADVVIRAYRAIGIDLQRLVHEDMTAHFRAYPNLWGLTRADSNIDHRRVPNLIVFFQRHGKILKVTHDPEDYGAGDIVTWNLNKRGSLPHIGIVTDRKSTDGLRPLLMHNIGGGQVLEDVLFAYEISGHYRYGLD